MQKKPSKKRKRSDKAEIVIDEDHQVEKDSPSLEIAPVDHACDLCTVNHSLVKRNKKDNTKCDVCSVTIRSYWLKSHLLSKKHNQMKLISDPDFQAHISWRKCTLCDILLNRTETIKTHLVSAKHTLFCDQFRRFHPEGVITLTPQVQQLQR